MNSDLDSAFRTTVLAAIVSAEFRQVLGELVREAVASAMPSGLRVAEFARRSGLPASTVSHLCRTGQLRHKRIGRSIIIDASELRTVPDSEIAAMAARVRGR
jgi:hypothetical protein